jgi:hypothetical protein
MTTSMNNQANHDFLPRRWMAAVVAYSLVGNLSPLGMRALDCLNVEPPLSDITLTIVLCAVAGMIYCLICPKRRKMI